MSDTAGISPVSGIMAVTIICRPEEETDIRLARYLESQLIQKGYSVNVDREMQTNIEWAKSVGEQIKYAQAVVPLLSLSACESEMIAFQVETAHAAAQKNRGRPGIIPVRIGFSENFPEPLAGMLDPIEQLLWEAPEDDDRIAAELIERLQALSASQPRGKIELKKGLRLVPKPAKKPRPIKVPEEPSDEVPPSSQRETESGAVPLDSPFYIQRGADRELQEALIRYDSIILVKGARQIGKTSLMARGLQLSRERGAKVASTDFQKFNASNLDNVSNFYLSLAESLADQLDLGVLPSDVWDERRGANVNFERFIRREVLKRLNAPLVWGLDEVDRLFTCDYGSEVFGLFRSWHNERALDPAGPWAGLTLVIAYATEAHLFITDMNQSPFNVGTRLMLEDFDVVQVSKLNEKYNSPLKNQEDIDRYMNLVAGHPFLVRRGLRYLASDKMELSAFEASADQDNGIFGDHLRRILVLLAKDSELTQIMKGVIKGEPCPTPESFYRLRSAGLIIGNSQSEVQPRCHLYKNFLSRHLS